MSFQEAADFLAFRSKFSGVDFKPLNSNGAALGEFAGHDGGSGLDHGKEILKKRYRVEPWWFTVVALRLAAFDALKKENYRFGRLMHPLLRNVS